jgi:hypothetical protein
MAAATDLLFSDGAAWFSVPALVGTLGYLLRLTVVVLVGGDHDGGGHHDGGDVGGHVAATMLSVQGFLTFAMGFGWGGLGAYRGADWSAVVSTMVGVACGVALVALLVVTLRATRRLHSSGNIELQQFVGAEAEAYTIIPKSGAGRGQISAVIGDRQRYVYAVSEGEELPARTRLRIIRVNGDNTVTVSRA